MQPGNTCCKLVIPLGITSSLLGAVMIWEQQCLLSVLPCALSLLLTRYKPRVGSEYLDLTVKADKCFFPNFCCFPM